jgi:uncharacterized protein (TIGR00251 family)
MTTNVITRRADGTVDLEVLVQPRASKSELAGIVDGRLKIRLAAPPVDGEANAALVEFLAEKLGLPKKAVELVRGQTGRRKTVRLTGAEASSLHALTGVSP